MHFANALICFSLHHQTRGTLDAGWLLLCMSWCTVVCLCARPTG